MSLALLVGGKPNNKSTCCFFHICLAPNWMSSIRSGILPCGILGPHCHPPCSVDFRDQPRLPLCLGFERPLHYGCPEALYVYMFYIVFVQLLSCLAEGRLGGKTRWEFCQWEKHIFRLNWNFHRVDVFCVNQHPVLIFFVTSAASNQVNMRVCNFPSVHWGILTAIHIRSFLTPHPLNVCDMHAFRNLHIHT